VERRWKSGGKAVEKRWKRWKRCKSGGKAVAVIFSSETSPRAVPMDGRRGYTQSTLFDVTVLCIS
jgi:hypothetical protein